MSGPLAGVRIVELAGIGPGPYTCMLLADAGADVLRVDRATPMAASGLRVEDDGPDRRAGEPHWDLLNRSRRSVAVDLKHPAGVELVLDLSTRPTASWRGGGPAWPSASASAPTPARRATPGSCTGA